MEGPGKIKHSRPVPPFLRWCSATIPAAFDDSLTYYEALCSLWKWLQTNLVQVVNNNATVTQEYIQMVDELKEFVDDYFENLDVQEEINNKLDELVEDGTLERIIATYLPKNTPFALYAFFDTTNSNKISFYASEDMLHLRKLNIETNLSGRDPSLYYKDGKFYVAITNYTTTYDFSIYESTDLQTWTKHEINLGLYNPTYPKIWAPQWFEDGDKLYILFSRQYANTEGNGDFETYITECEDLDNFVFSNPVKIEITGNETNNFIDACVFKENGIYNLILKNEHQGVLRLCRFTSSALDGTFTLVDDNYGKFGYRVEGEFVIKNNGKYYLYAENYSANITPPSAYYVAESTDGGLTFTNAHLIQCETDLSHGSGIMCDEETAAIIKNIDNFAPKFTNEFIQPVTSYIAAFDTYVNGAPIANYLKLFSIKAINSYRSITLDFSLANYTSSRLNFNSNFHMVLYTNNTNNPTSYYPFIYETSRTMIVADQVTPSSLFGKVICYYNANDGVYDVVLDISEITENSAIGVNFAQINNGGNYQIITKHDETTNTIGSEVTASIRDSHKSKTQPNPRTLYIDNGAKNTATIKMACVNGSFKLHGEENGVTDAKRIDMVCLVNNGTIGLINLNSNSTSTITASVEDYTNNIYTIKLSGLANYSGIYVELPNYNANSILGLTLTTEE